ILRMNTLVHTQNAIGDVIDILNARLNQATNPNVIAALQRQIAAKQVQFQNFQIAINRNSLILQTNLTVLNPRKDNLLATLSTLPRPQRQIAMVITAATQRQNTYATIMQNFLRAHPVTPITPF